MVLSLAASAEKLGGALGDFVSQKTVKTEMI